MGLVPNDGLCGEAQAFFVYLPSVEDREDGRYNLGPYSFVQIISLVPAPASPVLQCLTHRPVPVVDPFSEPEDFIKNSLGLNSYLFYISGCGRRESQSEGFQKFALAAPQDHGKRTLTRCTSRPLCSLLHLSTGQSCPPWCGCSPQHHTPPRCIPQSCPPADTATGPDRGLVSAPAWIQGPPHQLDTAAFLRLTPASLPLPPLTVSSHRRSSSMWRCCLAMLSSQRPPRLFLLSSHMGWMPSCGEGQINCLPLFKGK